MITLKNVKLHPDMSQETNCFSATIYVGSKKAGTVSNEGHGASHRYWWEDRDLHQQIEAWVEKQPTEFEFEKLDQIIDGLLVRDEIMVQIKRLNKKGTHFRLKGDAVGEWRKLNATGGKPATYTPQAKAYLEKSYGDKLECILNEDLNRAVELSMVDQRMFDIVNDNGEVLQAGIVGESAAKKWLEDRAGVIDISKYKVSETVAN